MRARIKGVKQSKVQLANGTLKIFYYHRATKFRLPDDPNTAAFMVAVARLDREAVDYAAAVEARENAKTISWLIRKYQQSLDWTSLAASTRRVEQVNIKAIEKEFGDMPLEAIGERGARSVFLEWRDYMSASTPRAADAKLARLARIFSFGLDREELTVNPLATFKRAYKGDRSEILWLPEHVEAFAKVAPIEIQIALTFALHTGQRKGDLFALTWNQYDGKGLSIRQSKTDRRVYIPCTRALIATLDAMPRRAVQILTDADGTPWTHDSFRTPWDNAFGASNITEDLHFHDARGTAVTMLAEAGCEIPEIASITGHTLASANKILETYLARTRILAERAIAKLELRLQATEVGDDMSP